MPWILDRTERLFRLVAGGGLVYISGHAFAAGDAVLAVFGVVFGAMGLFLVATLRDGAAGGPRAW